MNSSNFESYLDADQRSVLSRLTTPARIQTFLDEIPYSTESRTRCAADVMKDRVAHCLDGGLFAAAALRQIGYPPLLVDIFPDPGRDDDHVLALFKQFGCWGVVAKSNFTWLRFREPVYRTLRELVLSYFEVFFSLNGEKTLRTYTRPYNLQSLDKFGWMWNDEGAKVVEHRLNHLKRISLITQEMAASLNFVDQRSYQSGMFGVNEAGLYKPKT
jgi:hypothetical protein